MFASLTRSFLGCCSTQLPNPNPTRLLNSSIHKSYLSQRYINSTTVHADSEDHGSPPEERALLEAVSSSETMQTPPPSFYPYICTHTHAHTYKLTPTSFLFFTNQQQLKESGVNPNHIINYRTQNNDSTINQSYDDLLEELDDPWMRSPMEFTKLWI